MSLGVLVILVVAGVSLVVVVVAFSGVSHSARIESEEQARALLANEFPEAQLGEALLSADGRAAFFQSGNDGIAIAAAMGDRYVLRLYERGAIRGFATKDDGTVRLRLRDFSFPALRLRFANGAEADNLAAWLEKDTFSDTGEESRA